MRKSIFAFFVTFGLLLSGNASAQVRSFQNRDGVTVHSSRLIVLKLDLLMKSEIDLRLVSMEKDGEDLGYAFLVTSNYGQPTASAERNILFRVNYPLAKD